MVTYCVYCFFFSSRRRHTRLQGDWSSDVCSSDLLFAGGLEVTAIHNHLNEMSPHVMYMHYSGHGDAVQMARALRQALSVSGTPLGGGPPAAAPAPGPTLDTKEIGRASWREKSVDL